MAVIGIGIENVFHGRLLSPVVLLTVARWRVGGGLNSVSAVLFSGLETEAAACSLLIHY